MEIDLGAFHLFVFVTAQLQRPAAVLASFGGALRPPGGVPWRPGCVLVEMHVAASRQVLCFALLYRPINSERGAGRLATLLLTGTAEEALHHSVTTRR